MLMPNSPGIEIHQKNVTEQGQENHVEDLMRENVVVCSGYKQLPSSRKIERSVLDRNEQLYRTIDLAGRRYHVLIFNKRRQMMNDCQFESFT